MGRATSWGGSSSADRQRSDSLTRFLAAQGGLPKLASVLPTVGPATEATSIAAGAVHSPLNNPERFTLIGADWHQVGPVYPNEIAVAPFGLHISDLVTDNFVTGGRMRFTSSAPKLEIHFLWGDPSGGGFRLKVDGEYVSTGTLCSARDGLIAHGNLGYLPITWGDGSEANNKLRHYEIVMGSNGRFVHVRTPATHSVAPWNTFSPRLAINGDSMVNTIVGVTNTLLHPDCSAMLADLAGCPDTWGLAVGGTGFLADMAGGRLNFVERTSDLIAADPDIILDFGGRNDPGEGTAAAMEAAVTAWIDEIITAKPEVAILMTDALMSRASQIADPTYQAFGAAKQAAAAKFPKHVEFISNAQLQWLTSEGGNVAAPTGTGEADWAISSDNVHPTGLGAIKLAGVLSRETKAAATRLLARL